MLTNTTKTMKGKLVPYKCDLSNTDDIEKMFKWINANHKGVDLLVNNAGVSTNASLLGKSYFCNYYKPKYAIFLLRNILDFAQK